VNEQVEASLRAALERGIEAAFQLEDSELSGERLPDDDERGRMLFNESAEGGAGVLRRLVMEPDALALAARKALEIAHFHPDTGEDLGHAPGASEQCVRGCYDCLLAYGNQLEHELIDRHSVRDLLLELARSTTQLVDAKQEATPADGDALVDGAVTAAQQQLVQLLRDGGHALPTGVNEQVPDARARPDLVFRSSSPVAVFIRDDGVADPERDESAEDRLMDLGWDVITLGSPDEWTATIAKRTDVFGAGRTSPQ
jgi:hypothetical protein